MGTWDLVMYGRSGQLALGMSPFGEPDNWAVDRRGRPTILEYDSVELHFFDDALGLVHAEVHARRPRAFDSNRLGLAADEFAWPIDFDELAIAAKARGVPAKPAVDVLDRAQLTIGHATVTDADDTMVVSVMPLAGIDF